MMTRILECTPPRHTESHRTFTVVTKCRKRQNRHTSCPSVLLNKTDKAINAKTEGQMTAQTKAERIFSAELTAGAIQVRWCRMLKRHKEYFRNSLRYAYQCLGSRGSGTNTRLNMGRARTSCMPCTIEPTCPPFYSLVFHAQNE